MPFAMMSSYRCFFAYRRVSTYRSYGVLACALASSSLRAIAAFASKRLSVLPDVPALGELGYEGMDIAPIVGVVAPRNTAPEVVRRLNSEIVRAVRDPEVSGKLSGLGLEIIADTPEQFAAFLQSEASRWLPFIRSLNIKLD